MRHRLIFYLSVAVAVCSTCLPAYADDIFTVVIDAGHGGKDPGAVNGKYKEKTVNLNVALRTGELIERNCSNVRVIYTRKQDVFVPLNTRAEIANRAKADLFISIHTNASASSSPYGVETYLLGAEEERTSANLSVAIQENKAILLEDDYKVNYAGYDPNSTESQIIFEFMQNEYQRESLKMAGLVQQELSGYAKRRDRGVHQAGFLVLWKSAMPSILVELGFISNQTDLKYMTSANGVEVLSSSIYRAFSKYLDEVRTQQSEIETAKKNATVHNGTPVFKVQFLASSTAVRTDSPKFKGLPDVDYYKDGDIYKYTAGNTTDYDEAARILKKVRASYGDAFIIAFRNGERTDLQQARKEAAK